MLHNTVSRDLVPVSDDLCVVLVLMDSLGIGEPLGKTYLVVSDSWDRATIGAISGLMDSEYSQKAA